MINFRFHIVSLTAAFLAFTVGLLLGTNFLADASKDYLEGRIDNFADQLKKEKSTNSQLKKQLSSLEGENRDLDQQIGERLFPGLMRGEPVLVVAPRGLSGDPNPVDRVSQSLQQANAAPVGTWWLTDRLVLDNDDEVADLAAILGANSTDPAVLRQQLADQLAAVLGAAIDTGATSRGGNAEPNLLARLHEAGFVDYDLPDGAGGDTVQLPQSGLRVVVVTGQGATLADGGVLFPMLKKVAADGPVPVVVSQTPVTTEDVNASPTEPLVTALRHDNGTKGSISTVDDMDRVSGRIATVLALHDAKPGSPSIGHYGLRDDAQRLLPALRE
jgi:hypothetical protein